MKVMQDQSISYSKMPKAIKLYRATFAVGLHTLLAHHSRPAAMECIKLEPVV